MPFLETSCIYVQRKGILKTLVIYLNTLRIFYGLKLYIYICLRYGDGG